MAVVTRIRGGEVDSVGRTIRFGWVVLTIPLTATLVIDRRDVVTVRTRVVRTPVVGVIVHVVVVIGSRVTVPVHTMTMVRS